MITKIININNNIMTNNTTVQTLNIPHFQIDETCENHSNLILKELSIKKQNKIFNIFKRKRSNRPNFENLSPLEIFKVDNEVLKQKAIEAENLKKIHDIGYFNWMNNVQNFAKTI